jgi:DNA-binding MarR family transcriptional regulator
VKLSELLKQETFSSAAEKAFLNVMATSNWITREVSQLMGEYGLTIAQYNVLRILRGSHPDPLTCGEIRDRLLDRTPDVTRLLDRLEENDYLTRSRYAKDRRVMKVNITDEGLRLVNSMDDDVTDLVERLNRHLTQEEREELAHLLTKMRRDQ